MLVKGVINDSTTGIARFHSPGTVRIGPWIDDSILPGFSLPRLLDISASGSRLALALISHKVDSKVRLNSSAASSSSGSMLFGKVISASSGRSED